MKKYFYVLLLLAPFLLVGQGPSFIVTDQDGNVWDSDSLLEDGTTIIVEFFSPSMTCWPSSNAVQNITEAYNEMYHCNKLFFLQVAQWGYSGTVENFIEEFGDTNIPYIAGYDTWIVETTTGQELTIEWMDFGLMWAYECWILRPDGSYEYDLPGMAGLETNALIEFLEDEGFTPCENTVEIEEYQIENKNENIYDITGRILPEIPSQGTYIKDGDKYHVIK